MAMVLSLVRQRIVSCSRCARLRSYCERVAREKNAAHRDEPYWGRPVPGFGDPNARLLVLGLAPAAHGANRTGRVFTGDGSGDFLMRAMHRAGFASLPTSRGVDDGLLLSDAYISAAVRCAPPDNKPTREELSRCREHLVDELAALPNVCVVVALGRIAFDAYLKIASAIRPFQTALPAFRHGEAHPIVATGVTLIASYHPSRQNTNTGRLTPQMLNQVFLKARRNIDRAAG
ncbi:MAG: uracil-DNA glycosylase [Acidobacteria bacterium]|nr:uracil-DNA glycosylase [Acidobacteriota bacterium]